MRTLIIILYCLFTLSVFAQSNISVGSPAPEINITGWLSNVPADKNLKDKYVVLEFWATWCGPCLAAVPHLNELQATFDQPDLYFVSITDEPAARAASTIKRVGFESIVVTDETKRTQVEFGDGKKGLEKFPLTVLIDRANIIRWVGEPKELTEEVMKDFLADRAIEPKVGNLEIRKKQETQTALSRHMSLVKDTTISWYLDISENTAGPAANRLSVRGTDLYCKGISLRDLFVEIMPEKEIVLPSTMLSKAYTVYYLNKTGSPETNDRFTRALAGELGLRWEIDTIERPGYELLLTDRSKLDPAKSKFGTQSSIDDVTVVFSGCSLANLGKGIRDYSDYTWSYGGNETESYAFIIDTTSPETIRRSLREYGIQVKEISRKVEVIRFL